MPLIRKTRASGICFPGFLHPLVLCVSAVKILGKGEFCKQAKRGRNSPITRLEMVSSAFHSQAKRDRNAGETQPKPERLPCEKHAGTLVQAIWIQHVRYLQSVSLTRKRLSAHRADVHWYTGTLVQLAQARPAAYSQSPWPSRSTL